MSTIAGRLNLDGRPVEREAIARMLAVQNHRGPGRKEVWVDGSVGLGHGQNLIADHTRYPLQSADGRLTLVADARIDNREELARVLDVDLLPDEDGPLILAAYERWGADCAERLRGDFAFVIWDAEERRLFGARDIFGVRPLFYHHQADHHFVFSTEIKGLWCHTDLEKRLDEIRLAEALQLADTDPYRTMFEGVRACPAAHTVTVTKDTLTFRRYWYPERVEQMEARSDEQYAAEVRALLLRAVDRRMRGTTDLGIELSGGLDSSAIACAARYLRKEEELPRLHTISLRYPNSPETDEGEYITAVTSDGGFLHHEIDGESRSNVQDLDEIISVVDDPSLIAANHHLVWMRCQEARKHGARVVLTGYDGDTIVGHGFDLFYEMVRLGQWDRLLEESRLFEERLLESGAFPEDQIYLSPEIALRTFGIGALQRAAVHGAVRDYFRILQQLHRRFGVKRRKYFRHIRRLFVPYALLRKRHERRMQVSKFVAPAVARRTNLRRRAFESELDNAWPVDDRREQLRTIQRPGFIRTIDALDAYAGACGLDVRHPFLDQDLVEYCLGLPTDQKFQAGWSRFVLRNAMRGILPEKVRTRPGKTNFSGSTRRQLFQQGAPLLQKVVAEPGVLAQYVAMDYVREVIAGGPERKGQDTIRLSHIVALHKWLHLHFGPLSP